LIRLYVPRSIRPCGCEAGWCYQGGGLIVLTATLPMVYLSRRHPDPGRIPMAAHRFGDFVLDEEARSLTLRGQVVPVQPLVLDLLAYLVRNAGRVVPKDELMDALWPDVNVTEASLQRAISLARRALAAGGLETAIRSYTRHGYRFGIDPGLGQAEPAEPAGDEDLATARKLAQARDWPGAAAIFARLAEAGTLSPADIDLWALAVECQGRPVAAVPVLTRAVTAHVEAGQPGLAARAAITLARIQADRGAGEVATGWLERAESLLAECDDCWARAYLLWMRARAAAFEGRHEDALDLAAASCRLAETCSDPGMKALTLAYMGFYNLSLGRVAEGSRQQNHAAAIALSSRVDPITGSEIYCNILWSCRMYADWSRARQWFEGFESWCESSFAKTPGACDLHRAEVAGAQRTLGEALAAIEASLPKLSDEESWSIGDGYRVRGDIHAMIGNLAAARADYEAAYAVGWDAEPGNAVLLFESGNVDGALAALDRALEGQSWFHVQRRGLLLVNAARIAALGGRPERATELLAEIEAKPERWSQPAVRALITETRAALCGPDDPETIRLLLLARQLWTSAGVDYQAARVRLQLARAFVAAGDVTGADAEMAAAVRTASRIGSRRILDAAALQPSPISRPERSLAFG
jgi:DNA-binding winged helix-turn-helix (wHTH) protein/tetratricopeptide (TPR) repeat protein